MVPRAFQKHLSNQHPNLHRFWSQLGPILGGFWRSRWGQDGTKSLQKSIPKTIQKNIIFLIAPRSIFERFWGPSWPPIGETNLSILEIFSILEPSWAQEPPKIPPRGPQDPPRPLQEASWDRFLTIWGSNLIVFGVS